MDPKREKAINDYIKAVKENNEARAEVMRRINSFPFLFVRFSSFSLFFLLLVL